MTLDVLVEVHLTGDTEERCPSDMHKVLRLEQNHPIIIFRICQTKNTKSPVFMRVL
jgi:hypothetical protein